MKIDASALKALIFVGLLLCPSSGSIAEEPAQQPCVPTAENILGPYYRANAPFRTRLVQEDQVGIPLLITGSVADTACHPIKDALIEIWQTDHQGAYDNETAEFRFRGRLQTDTQGQYRIETVVPGRYAIGERVSGYGLREAVYRPRHVHFKITKPGFKDLITQLYFKDDPYNDKDPYVVKSLIVEYETHGSAANEYWAATFDIVLEQAKE